MSGTSESNGRGGAKKHASAIYTGNVMHCRTRPRRHAFRYTAYWLLLDLDELPNLSKYLWTFSYNRWNLFSLHSRDHGHEEGQAPLRNEIETNLRQAGIDLQGGPIKLLCMPRVLGFTFNPLSVLFCYHHDGDLLAIAYEVHNTFSQRHSYLIGVPRNEPDGPVEQSCSKTFYVSPFMPMGMTYEFRVEPPKDSVRVVINGSDSDGPLITASLAGTRSTLSDAALLKQFLLMPFLTLKVVAAIHWEALRLWLKGIRLVERPNPPSRSVSVLPEMENVRVD